MIQITGKLRDIYIKTRKPYHVSRYCPGEQTEYYADCVLETETDTVYFQTPAVKRTVATGGPFAVVCYHFPARGNGFMREVGENAVAQPGKPNDNRLELTVYPGDKITIEGRVKAEKVSKRGNPYRTLTHVTLLHTHEDRVHRVGEPVC